MTYAIHIYIYVYRESSHWQQLNMSAKTQNTKNEQFFRESYKLFADLSATPSLHSLRMLRRSPTISCRHILPFQLFLIKFQFCDHEMLFKLIETVLIDKFVEREIVSILSFVAVALFVIKSVRIFLFTSNHFLAIYWFFFLFFYW